MKHTIVKICVLLTIVGIGISCQDPTLAKDRTDPTEEITAYIKIDSVASDSVNLGTDSSSFFPNYVIDYETYLRWRDLARILYDANDTNSYRLYKKLVLYMEQYNQKSSDFDPTYMESDLAQTFASITNPTAQVKIDSLLVYHGFSAMYQTNPQN
ncbi:MAG: hypothetical protein AAFN93_16565 [Bacteroidota bacterium]